MACTDCGKKKTLCGGKPCGCPIPDLSADCVIYKGNALSCTGIETPDTLENVIEKIDKAICDKFNDIVNYGALVNIGEGSQVFKAVNNLGQRELRTFISSDGSVTITQYENEIDFLVDIPDIPTIDPVEEKALEDVSTTAHTPIYLGEENNIHRFAGLKSDSLSIETDELGNLQIENPPSFVNDDGIPRFIVNNRYTGTPELGTVSKPFKTIQNALSAFVGTGTKENPQYQNGIIIIQQGDTYNFTGNFTYRNLNVVVEEGAVINHNPPTGGWLIDYDELNETATSATLTLASNSVINVSENGVRTRGTDELTGTGAKTITITGSGTLRQNKPFTTGYALIESNYDANQSGSYIPFTSGGLITASGVTLISNENALIRVGGAGSLRFDNVILRSGYSDSNTSNTKAFQQIGKNIEIRDSTIIFAGNGPRHIGFELKSYVSSGFYYGGTLRIENTVIQPQPFIETLFYCDTIGSSAQSNLVLYNNTTRYGIIEKIFDTDTGVWAEVIARNNIFSTGVLTSDVDLTQGNTMSVHNTIGNYDIYSLPVFADANAAQNLPSGSLYKNITTLRVELRF